MGADDDVAAEAFFTKTQRLRPAALAKSRADLDRFVLEATAARRKLALVTSGGTTVPLEAKTVRFIDNFSSGTRGSLCTEEFLKAGYFVILLHRTGSSFPFMTELVRSMQQSPLKLLKTGQFQAERPSNELLDRFLAIPFTTIFDYLFLLREAAQSCSAAGPDALILLAAAVSDFYVPEDEMAVEKIQSRASDGLSIQLRNVPKLLGAVRAWAPEAQVVSFKLETNENILLAKAAGALKKYNVDAVCSNLLHNYRDVVTIIWPEQAAAAIEIGVEHLTGEEQEAVEVRGIASKTLQRGELAFIDVMLVRELVALHRLRAEVRSSSSSSAPAAVEAPRPAAPCLDLDAEFQKTYAEASRLIGVTLSVPPVGDAYAAAMSSLNCLSNIIDRVFQAWGNPEELGRVTRIKEESQAFTKNFGFYRQGSPVQDLLRLAGFQRSGEDGSKVWAFPPGDPSSVLRAMTVKCCFQRLSELQRQRGTHRWASDSNEQVIPKADDGSLLETLELYRTQIIRPALDAKPSLKERSLEAQVRLKLQERRTEAKLPMQLIMHEGLAAVARLVAQAQRTQNRLARDQEELPPLGVDLQELIPQLPLPPGVEIVQLHWSTSDLPRVFGITLTATASDEGDPAVDILARESVGFWAARQAREVTWPSAALCGVGAALDYTVSRGFIVALCAGFEGVTPQESLSGRRRDHALQQRMGGSSALGAAPTAQGQGEPEGEPV